MEDQIAALLDDLDDLLSPVVNTGASRDQLHTAAREALALIREAWVDLELDISDEDELEEDEDDEQEEGDELEEGDPAEEGDEEQEEHVQL